MCSKANINLTVFQFDKRYDCDPRKALKEVYVYLTSVRSVMDAEFSKYPEPKESIASPFVLVLYLAGVALVSDGNWLGRRLFGKGSFSVIFMISRTYILVAGELKLSVL